MFRRWWPSRSATPAASAPLATGAMPVAAVSGAPSGHWWYLAFFIASVFLALWQHGHPLLTLGVVVATPLVGALIYLPSAWLPPRPRQWLQNLLGLGSVAWMAWRGLQQLTPDLVLVEGFAVMGLSLFITARPRDYGYAMAVGLLLTGYGSVLPPRVVYPLVMPLAALLGLLLLYRFRGRHLVGLEHAVSGVAGRVRGNTQMLVHFGVLLVMAYGVLSLFPSGGSHLPGLSQVSFIHSNRGNMPPALRDWWRGPFSAPDGLAAERFGPDGQPLPGAGDPNSPLRDPNADVFSGSGDGNGGMVGNDLVMRIRSPLRLYWLQRLYDQYDGRIWRPSVPLRDSRLSPIVRDFEHTRVVEQQVELRRPASKYLPGAFWCVSATSSEEPLVATRRNIYENFLPPGAPLPPLPMVYLARSFLYSPPPGAPSPPLDLTLANPMAGKGPGPGARLGQPARTADDDEPPALKPPKRLIQGSGRSRPPPGPVAPAPVTKEPYHHGTMGLWYEGVPPNHYLQLPEGAVSQRLRDLVRDLVAPHQEPLARAMALRDYLRGLEYSIESQAPPAERETVDYFVFELRRGHCEYFASAMTVMARLAGLPARLASGYSPGTFNVLSGLFEVYEYHGHAWSQVFVNGYGWLTMDATPSNALPLQNPTSPPMLGAWRDPFSDDWQVRTPELSADAVSLNLPIEQLRDMQARQNMVSRLLGQVPVADAEARPTLTSLGAGEGQVRPSAPGRAWADIGVLAALHGNLRAMMVLWRLMWQRFLAAMTVQRVLLGIGLCLGLIAGLLIIPRWLARRAWQRRLRRSEAWFQQARGSQQTQPATAITLAYYSLRELLDLRGWGKAASQDLLAYGAELQQVDPRLAADAFTIFELYTRLRYSPVPPTAEEAATAIQRATQARQFLLGPAAST